MLNLKNIENDAQFDKICKKKKKIKIQFIKMKGTFLDSIPWLKVSTATDVEVCEKMK